MKQWKRKIDYKMRSFGETDYSRKLIRVNPKKGELLNTICEEELHKRFGDDVPEKVVKKKALELEKKLTIKKAIQLLKKYA